jgi:hypothetical protein
LDYIEVEIINWSRYNLRTQIKSPRWFALSNRVLEDSDFFGFSDAEFKAWIYILCQASQRNSSRVRLNPEHAQRACGVLIKSLNSALTKLQIIKCIQYQDHGVITNDHDMITTGQDRTGQRTPYIPQTGEQEFLLAKEKYKTKFPGTAVGPKALDRFKEQIKTPEDFESLMGAIGHYAEMLSGEEWRKPKTTFANFLGTKKSGYFWHDFRDRVVIPMAGSICGIAE